MITFKWCDGECFIRFLTVYCLPIRIMQSNTFMLSASYNKVRWQSNSIISIISMTKQALIGDIYVFTYNNIYNAIS